MKTGKHHKKKKICGIQQKLFWKKFIVIQAYLKIQEKPQTNSLILHLKELQRRKQSKVRKKSWKIRVEKKEIETKNRREETKSWFFEKINKIDNPLARGMEKKEGPNQ